VAGIYLKLWKDKSRTPNPKSWRKFGGFDCIIEEANWSNKYMMAI
jgi:hypothetical protein